MLPLVDLHCHLLAGLDDGPKTHDEALAMCELALQEGVQTISALAHQNEHYPDVTPERIRASAQRLAKEVQIHKIPISVFPSAEIMVRPELEDDWDQHRLMSIADRGKYLLLEYPHGLFLDLYALTQRLRRQGLTPILAHPERQPELLHEPGQIERLIEAGCLVQVSSGSVTDPRTNADRRAVKSWVKRGVVHFLASDGHSPRRRAPRMADAYHQVRRWAGGPMADRIASSNGLAVVQGLPVRVAPPEPLRRPWLLKFW